MSAEDDVDALRRLVERVAGHLSRNRGHDPGQQQVLETHISVVLLSGDHAWKFKKPVDLGFADFTSLERRRYLCGEELRLNRRFAPGMYEAVDSVTGTVTSPELHPSDDSEAPARAGEALDYAVRMRRFSREQMLDALVEADAVDTAELGRLVEDIAAFHENAERARAGGRLGSTALVMNQVEGSLEHIAELDGDIPGLLKAALSAVSDTLATRQAHGFVRDCHGDLHLSNIVRLDGRLTPFDCIEFDEALRVVDTVSDFAFLLMDLDFRGRTTLANAAFNGYFEHTADYAGLRVLRLYLAYRSLVRAKVASLQAGAGDTSHQSRMRERAKAHVALARRYLAPGGEPAIWITHGFSGSGKSFHSRGLAERFGWLHLRSDVMRKRLLGLAPDAETGSRVGGGAYAESMNEQTYGALEDAARHAVGNGFTTIVDASFLSRARRARFRVLAESLGVPFRILGCDADPEVLRRRIRDRYASGGDPSEADESVLEHQLRTHDPLDREERACRVDAAAVSGKGEGAADGAPAPGRARPGLR